MHSLYLSEEKLSELCLEDDWYNIIRNQKTVYTFGCGDGVNWDISNPILLNLHKVGVSIEVDNDLVKAISQDESAVLDMVNPTYVLDYSKESTYRIENKYGVQFLPSKCTPRPILAKRGWSVETSDETKPNSWDYILKNIMVKSNSLILVDRYFFSKEYGQTIDDALFNLYKILENILPSGLVNNYTVSIVFDATKTSISMSDISTNVNKVKKKLSGKTFFDLELISINSNCYQYGDTHDRFIISNYFYLHASHQLRAFAEGNKSFCNQLINFEYLYSDGIEPGSISSIPEKTQDRVLSALRQSIRTSWDEIQYSRNGRVFEGPEVKNPLLCN